MNNEVEPILENILLSQKESSDETNRLLESVLEQTAKNDHEDVLEGSMMLLNDIKEKPTAKVEIEVNGAKMVAYEGPKGEEGPKGKDGKTPRLGIDYFTEQDKKRIITEVRKLIPTPKDGKTPVRGVDYFTDADIATLIKEVVPFLPRGKKGEKGDTGEVDYGFVVGEVMSRIKVPKDGKNGSPDSGTDIVSKLRALPKKEKLKLSDLDGVPEFKPASRDYDLTELKDVSISSPTNGQVLVYNSTTHKWEAGTASGGSFNVETPTGTVNGSNVSFTVSNTPKCVIIDGLTRFDGFGYTYSAGTITVDALVPPVSFIRSIY